MNCVFIFIRKDYFFAKLKKKKIYIHIFFPAVSICISISRGQRLNVFPTTQEPFLKKSKYYFFHFSLHPNPNNKTEKEGNVLRGFPGTQWRGSSPEATCGKSTSGPVQLQQQQTAASAAELRWDGGPEWIDLSLHYLETQFTLSHLAVGYIL